MKRKDYQVPTTRVVQLQHHGVLMTSGNSLGATATRGDGYGEAEVETWQ